MKGTRVTMVHLLMANRKALGLAAGAAALALAVACGGGAPSGGAPSGGDAQAGRTLFVSKGCVACHTVASVPEAKGTIGPDLTRFGGIAQIAGTLPNNTENLKKWLKDPPAVKPGTAMPNLGLSDDEVNKLTVYLQSLK